MKETYRVKTPNRISFGDARYMSNAIDEVIESLAVFCMPNTKFITRVVIEEHLDENNTETVMRTMSIYMVEERLSVYMGNMYYAHKCCHERNVEIICPTYMIDVDGNAEVLSFGRNGHIGTFTEYSSKNSDEEVCDAMAIHIIMPPNNTFEDMRERIKYLFSDVEQVENFDEAEAKQMLMSDICTKGLIVKDDDGNDIWLMAHFNRYAVKDYLGREMTMPAISLSVKTGNGYEPFATITKCFGEFISIKNVAYIDLNNCPFATRLLDLGVAADTGLYKESGFCRYPLWRFNEDFLKNIGGEEYIRYSDEYDQYMRGEVHYGGVQEMM